MAWESKKHYLNLSSKLNITLSLKKKPIKKCRKEQSVSDLIKILINSKPNHP